MSSEAEKARARESSRRYKARQREREGWTPQRRPYKPRGIDEVEWLMRNRYVDPVTGCWEWTGARFNGRYGMVRYKGSYVGAHRVMWLETFGPVPTGLWVLHTCDNPPCFNPAHLWLGTHQDNMLDKVAKGRDNSLRGEAIALARLTAADIPAIRADTRSDRIIGLDYGVSASTIWAIQAGRTWRHVA